MRERKSDMQHSEGTRRGRTHKRRARAVRLKPSGAKGEHPPSGATYLLLPEEATGSIKAADEGGNSMQGEGRMKATILSENWALTVVADVLGCRERDVP